MTEQDAKIKWQNIDWSYHQCQALKLQKRIYKAASDRDINKVRKIQRLLLKSYSARLLTVKRVTLDNKGTKTSGTDGIKGKSKGHFIPSSKVMNFQDRWNFVEKLRNLKNYKASPLRRVWIPKKNGKMRPLGIPVMYDRALQALFKMVIEPEWEAYFYPHSFGFRAGRGTADAITVIRNNLSYKKWILDADIKGCFDNINHNYLLEKINTFPTARRIIKLWLKSGVIDNKTFKETTSGTPQGGCISPLLANIALHGIEKLNRVEITKSTTIATERALCCPVRKQGRHGDKLVCSPRKGYSIDQIKENGVPEGEIIKSHEEHTTKTIPIKVSRYADDFIAIIDSETEAKSALETLAEFLKPIGLKVEPNKTRIVPATEWFNFLGYKIKVKANASKRSAGRVKIQPSEDSKTKFYRSIKEEVDKYRKSPHKIKPKQFLISLAPKIRGWVNYQAICEWGSWVYFMQARLDWLFLKMLRRTSQKANNKWNWEKFNNELKPILKKHGVYLTENFSRISLTLYLPVFNTSPYTKEWDTKHFYKKLNGVKKTLFMRQKGKCSECGYHFNTQDMLEVHHTDRNRANNKLPNLNLIHNHCHDSVHRMIR